jgi:hypothetical protein
VKEDVVSGTYRHFPNTKCVIYRMMVTEKEYKKIKRVIRRFEKLQQNYTFNLIGLLAVAIHKPIKRRKAYFCSQFVAEVFKKAGMDLFNKNSALVRPDDFRKLINMELIYEGRLYEYQKVIEKLSDELDLNLSPEYRFFLEPLKKTIRFVNPMFYYQYATEKIISKEKK